MPGVAHTPYLEKRPSGYFFRRRIPARLQKISNPGHGSIICLALRSEVLSDAKAIIRGLTALTDLAFALMTERQDMRHLTATDIRVLEALARLQIDAHEAARAYAGPRSARAAEAAAECERATQQVLRQAIACGNREIAREPLHDVAAHLGVVLPAEETPEGRALAFEALRVLLDVSRAREQAELGQSSEMTPVFTSVMARRGEALAPKATTAPMVRVEMAPVARAISPDQAVTAAPVAAPLPLYQSHAQAGHVPDFSPDPLPAPETAAHVNASEQVDIAERLHRESDAATAAPDQDVAADAEMIEEIRLKIKMRPPLLENIDVRCLSGTSQAAVQKARGITLPEAIELYAELKLAGYGDDFATEQTPVEEQGKRFRGHSISKINFARTFWPEFLGSGPVEEIAKNDIRDALAFLPRLPNKHSKGTDKFVAKSGFRELVERIDDRTENDHQRNLEQAIREGLTSEADKEAARLDAQVSRLRVETIVKHRRLIAAVGRMLVELQLADRNPFEICAVSNAHKKKMASGEESRKRTVWDDRIHHLFASNVFQGGAAGPGDPLFWLPLIARLMGLREEEACQLGPDDFGSDGGIHFVDIKRVNENHVKTDHSERRVPVHPQLIELGLLHLVEMRRRSGHKRLFIDLTRGKTKGKFSENFSKAFTYYRQTNDCYWPGLDFHAFRTTFHGDLMNQDKSDAIRCRLMGHERTDEGDRSYSQGLALSTLHKRICDVKIDLSRIVSPIRESVHSRGSGKDQAGFRVVGGTAA